MNAGLRPLPVRRGHRQPYLDPAELSRDASHQFTPDIFAYGTYSHGFRAGGYNDQVGTSGNPITDDEKKPTDPEKADSFELGLKSELWQRRLRLNEALFYVQYKDAIRQVVVPVTNSVGSAGRGDPVQKRSEAHRVRYRERTHRRAGHRAC